MDESLSFESLFGGAKKFAHRAMDGRRDNDDEVFVLNAGVSIERLLKAALVNVNAVLLMEPGATKDDRALLHFAGLRPSTERVRTVSASQALERVRSAGWLPRDKDLDELIELRNGVVHLGPADSEASDVLATFARTTNALLTHLKKDADEFWGSWQRTIDISLNDQLEKLDRDIQGRIALARHRYEEKIKTLPPIAIEALKVEAAAPVPARLNIGGVLLIVNGQLTCPACHNYSTVAGFREDLLGDGSLEERKLAFILAVCRLCGMGMTSTEEFEKTGHQLDEVLMADHDTTGIDGYLDQVLHRNRFEQPDPLPGDLTE